MALNGSGKSTLLKSAGRHPDYEVTAEKSSSKGRTFWDWNPHEGALPRIFLASSIPWRFPALATGTFLRGGPPPTTAPTRKARAKEEMDVFDFDDLIEEKLDVVKRMDASFLDRSVNEGFSGGEKKRNEILQMAPAGAAALHSGRNRLRPGHRRPEDRC